MLRTANPRTCAAGLPFRGGLVGCPWFRDYVLRAALAGKNILMVVPISTGTSKWPAIREWGVEGAG